MDPLIADAAQCLDALIGEIDGAGSLQKKTSWMTLGWRRRLTWVRWLRELKQTCESMGCRAKHAEEEIPRLKAEISMRRFQVRAAEDGRTVDKLNLLRCRQCSRDLLADGDGGWTCPRRFEHHHPDAASPPPPTPEDR